MGHRVDQPGLDQADGDLGRPRGRLLLDDRLGDVGGLRLVDATTAEIKRMYVRPAGRALLERLVDDARAEGYELVRPETSRS